MVPKDTCNHSGVNQLTIYTASPFGTKRHSVIGSGVNQLTIYKATRGVIWYQGKVAASCCWFLVTVA